MTMSLCTFSYLLSIPFGLNSSHGRREYRKICPESTPIKRLRASYAKFWLWSRQTRIDYYCSGKEGGCGGGGQACELVRYHTGTSQTKTKPLLHDINRPFTNLESRHEQMQRLIDRCLQLHLLLLGMRASLVAAVKDRRERERERLFW